MTTLPTIARALRDTKPTETDTAYPLLLEQWENDCHMVLFAVLTYHAVLTHHDVNDPSVTDEFFKILESND